MPYEAAATAQTPALIIYLLDVSGSMGGTMSNGSTRIDVLHDSLHAAAKQMVGRSTKGNFVSPRYRVGMYAYSAAVHDIMGGIMPIDALARVGMPKKIEPMDMTNTAEGFRMIKKLLIHEIRHLPPGSPAPLVCHLTDGEYSKDTKDPEPVIREIQALSTPDGNVLVENVFISDRLNVSTQRTADWPGYRPGDEVGDKYGEKLLAMSSPLPESYRIQILELGFHIQPGTLMMYPGIRPEFVQLAFVMSTMTKMVEAPARQPSGDPAEQN